MSKKWMTSVRAKNVEFRILKSGEAGWKYERAWKQAHVSFSTNCLVKGEHVMTVEFAYGKRIDVPIGDEMDKFQVQHTVGRVTITSHKKRSTFNIKNVSSDDARKVDVFLQKVLDEKKNKSKVTTPTKLHIASKSETALAGKLKSPNLDNSTTSSNAKFGGFTVNSVTAPTKGSRHSVIPDANTDEKENTTPLAGSSVRKRANEKNTKSKVTTPTKLDTASKSETALAGKLKSPYLDNSTMRKDATSSGTTFESFTGTSVTTPTKMSQHPNIPDANIDEKENTTPPAGRSDRKRSSSTGLGTSTATAKPSGIPTPTKGLPWKMSTDGKRKSSSPNHRFNKKNRLSNTPPKSITQVDVKSDVILPTLESPLMRRRQLDSKLQSPKSAKKDASKSSMDCKGTQITTPSKDSKKSQRKFDDFRRAQAEVRHAKMHTDLTDEKENTSPPSGSIDRKTTGITKRSFYGANTLTPSFASELSKVRIVHTTPSPSRKNQTPSKILAFGSGVRRSLLQDVPQKKSESFKKKSECTTSNDIGTFQFGSVNGTSLFGDNNNNDNNKENLSFQPLADTANFSFTSGEGFQNLGNTCYMNSTLQSLFGLLPFQYDLYALEKKLGHVLQVDSLLSSMVRLMKQRTSTDSEKRILLRKVKRAISASAKQFYGFSQHDAHEFLRLCLDLLQEDVTKANKVNCSESNNNNNISPTLIKESGKNKVDCPVAKNFSFSVVLQIVCNKCNSVAKAKDEWYDLPVELQQKSNESGGTLHLQNLINSSFAKENIEHVCEECKSNQATVTRKIVKLPRIMMIYLMRYSYNHTSDHSEKLRLPVALPLYVSFKHFCTEDVEIDTTVPDVNKGLHNNDGGKSPSSSTQMEVIIVASDDEPETKLPAVTTFLNNTPSTDECNNNAGNTNPSQEKTETINLLSSEDDKELTKALQISEMEFFDSQQYKGILEHDRLRNLSEDEQVLLAMQLSLQNDKDTSFSNKNDATPFLNNNTTSIDTNENITSLPRSDELLFKHDKNSSDTSVKPKDTNALSDQVEKQSVQTVPSISPEKKVSDSRQSHDSIESVSTYSFSTIGSTKLDAFLSDDSDHDDDVTYPVFNQNKPSECGQLAKTSATPASLEMQIKKASTKNTLPKVDGVCDQEIEAETNLYRLVSVVSHKGGSSNVGHYVSDVLSDVTSHKWQCFDDSHVENVSENEVLLGRQSTSYLLFYLHKDFLSLYKS